MEDEKRRKKKNKLHRQVVAITTVDYASLMASLIAETIDSDDDDSGEAKEKENHRTFPRGKRKVYDHDHCAIGLNRDYLRLVPLFDGKEFETMFRISKSRFQRLMEDIAASQNSFYLNTVDAAGKQGSSFHARLLLPLKTMAYGVAYHMLRDHFQMSRTAARNCCIVFHKTIKELYEKEYLRLPTEKDVKSIEALHKTVHKYPGMFGSLDCMHTVWKNCPVAWQGQYKGKAKNPTIVLEAISDYHMWFWHAAYGYAGTLNDLSILALSPFFASLLDGSFEIIEQSVVPFRIGVQEFQKMYILVDGIYPKYSRFVHGIKEPVGAHQQRYTAWQEASRKDIERAFALLQGKWQCMARPMHQMDLECIGSRVAACLILHNMCVSDRVMEDVRDVYDPAYSIVGDESSIEYPSELVQIRTPVGDSDVSTTGVSFASQNTAFALTRKERWTSLTDDREFKRLHLALRNEASL
jgi:Plant transposon protein